MSPTPEPLFRESYDASGVWQCGRLCITDQMLWLELLCMLEGKRVAFPDQVGEGRLLSGCPRGWNATFPPGTTQGQLKILLHLFQTLRPLLDPYAQDVPVGATFRLEEGG